MTQLSAKLSDTDAAERAFAEPRLTDARLREARLTEIKPNDIRLTESRLTDTGLNDNDLADLFGLPEEAGWQERALCAQTDPEAFFPEKGGSTREAKRICSGCEVRGECLEYALQHDERFGIWGGLSERERRKLKRRAV